MSLQNRFCITARFDHPLKVAGPGMTLISDRRRPFRANGLKGAALATAFIASVAGQIPLPPLDLSSEITGFEAPSGWVVKSNSAATRVSSTTTRTQGSFAYALVNPPGLATLTSLPVTSTTKALAGVSEAGAILEVDVMLPAEDGNTGSLKLSVSSFSRGISNELIGEVDLSKFRTGIYSTMQFPIPDRVRTALGNATFKDLVFELVLSSPRTDIPAASARQYLFDNLRVHSVPLVDATTGTKPPAGYGGSVNLEAIGDAPATQSFTIGAVQVPDSFHLTEGSAGTTTVTLALGHDGNPAFTCTYDADPADTSGQSYIVKSCTGGVRAGDLVGANFAQLAIAGASPLMKLRAQLARNPIGDLVGSGIVPPMPTFWGKFDTCVPAPVQGKVHTTSSSCDNQVAEANKIVTDYSNKVSDAKVVPNWIVTPTPDGALRHGNGLPNPNRPGAVSAKVEAKNIAPLDTPQTNDFPFDNSGHVNEGGDFDAYWRLNGDFNTSSDSSTGNGSTHFDAEFSGHVVLFGGDVNVVSVSATADTTSGNSPSATGSAHMFVLGIEIPGGGSADASTGFNFNISETEDVNVFEVRYWIFALEAGVTFSGGVNTTGTLAATGFNLSVGPFADMGAHIFGGIDVGFASGGVDARADLLNVSTPLTAQAGLLINTAPQSCSLAVDIDLNGSVIISSLGGEIDLVATFGDCPICYTVSHNLLTWSPITSTTQNLFSVGPTNLAAVPLPVLLCPVPPFNVTIQSPTISVPQSLPQKLVATANNTVGTVNCTWSGFQSGDTPPSPQGCEAQATFGNLGPRTLAVNAVNTVTDLFGRQFTATASASEALDVANLPPGDYITATSPTQPPVCSPVFGCTILQPPFNGQTLTIPESIFPASIVITGEVIPSAGTTTTWTATDSSGTTTTITNPPCKPPACIIFLGGDPDQVSVNWSVPKADVYTITMKTTDSGGRVAGTASMTVNVPGPPK